MARFMEEGTYLDRSSNGSAFDECVNTLERLRYLSRSDGQLKIFKKLEVKLKKPKYKVGQVVEASLRGIWYKGILIRIQNENNYSLRILDLDPRVKAECRSIVSEKIR